MAASVGAATATSVGADIELLRLTRATLVVAAEGLVNDVASVKPPLRADGRPQNHSNKVRNSSKGKCIVEGVHGVTTRKGAKSKSSSSGHGRTLPTNPML
ncbi:hypothetical protein OIU76_029997 [Salix suchowensis]|nr:hypothetical protein OIU76_029997 [Salix suchowensis]